MSLTAKIKITILLLFVGGIGLYFTKITRTNNLKHPEPVMNDTIPARPEPGLSPGTAKVRAEITGVDTTKTGKYVLNLEIKEILGYGSSTPPLATGQTMSIDAAGFFVSSNQSKRSIKPGKKVIALIRYTQSMQMGTNEKTLPWSLAEIEEYSNRKNE